MELEGNSNSGASVAFLTKLKEKHPGPLRVIWDNAPAHRGEAVREYLRTPELELRLVNLRATARTSTPARLSGAGRERRPLAICAWGAGRRCRACPCVGRGEGRQIPGRAVQPERRGETALPDGPVIKGRNTPARLPPRFPAPVKSTSHLGFGLVLQRRFLNLVSYWPEMSSRKARPQSCQARGQVAMKRCSRSLSCEASL